MIDFFEQSSRDPERISLLLAEIEKIWKQSPQLRLGQLLGNCVKSDLKLYYMEDDTLLQKLKEMYTDYGYGCALTPTDKITEQNYIQSYNDQDYS